MILLHWKCVSYSHKFFSKNLIRFSQIYWYSKNHCDDGYLDSDQISNPAVNTYIHTLQDNGVTGFIQNGNMTLSGFLFEELL